MNQDEFGKLIKEKRKEKGLTQSELAEKLNISSYKTISKWENGIYLPDISLLLEISEILDVSLYELLGGKEKENMKEEHVEEVLKTTINKANEKNKILKLLKKIIIILALLLIIITTTFVIFIGILKYGDVHYLFSVKPEEISLININKYPSFNEVNEYNFYTKYIKEMKQVGVEEALCQNLPLYETKNASSIRAENNKIIYTFNPNDSESDINKDFHDESYTKKSMYIISIILYSKIGSLEEIQFRFNDNKYSITQTLMDEYYDFDINYDYFNSQIVPRKYLNLENVNNMVKDNKFLKEFFNKAKV